MIPLSRSRLIFLLIVLGLGWWAVEATRFEERLILDIGVDKTRLRLNQIDREVPISPGHTTAVEILCSETFEQIGGGSVTISSPGQPTRELSLPRRWKFETEKRPPPVGDWWVDRMHAPELIASTKLELQPPFTIVAVNPARTLQAFRIRLQGETLEEIGLRSGLLNNDLYISRPSTSSMETFLVGGPMALDLRRSVGPVAKGVCLGAAVCLIFSLLAALGGGPKSDAAWITPRLSSAILWLCLLIRFGFSCYIAVSIFHQLPTFQDDLCYYLRAQWILQGHFDLPAPPGGNQLLPPFTSVVNGRWLTPYPLNWSLLIAIGMAAGAPWIASPICAAVAVWAQFQTGRTLGGDRLALLSALLLATSPFCLVFSGSMMNHAAASMFLGLFGLGFVRGWPEGKAPRLGLLVAAGAALGFAFGIRPLTAAAVGLPTLLLGLWEWKLRRFSGRAFVGLVCFAGGVFLGMSTAILDNAMVTGTPIQFAYTYRGTIPPLAERLPSAAFWSDRSMAQLPYLLSGWGWPWLRDPWWLCLPYAIAAAPFLLGRAGRHDWFALGVFVVVVAAHYSHEHGTIHGFGPRIYVDGLWALFLLIARGWQCLAQAAPAFGRSAGPWAWRVAAVVALSLPLSSAIKLPARLEGYRGYNEIDRKFLGQFAALGEPRALFILSHDALQKWIRAAPLIPLDPVSSPYVFATRAARNDEVIALYGKDRPVYLVEEHGIFPYAESPGASK